MPRRTRKTASRSSKLLAALASSNAETRWRAAQDLGACGDRSAILPLEHLALMDDDSFQAEGAFVDTTEFPSEAALDALGAIYARHPPSAEDLARVRAHLCAHGPGQRNERLALALGPAALEAVTPLLAHADPGVRLRAWNLAGHARGERTNYGLWVDDEAVRLAATQQDAYRGHLMRDALARFRVEQSLDVRRGICDLWLRYRARMGGWLYSRELADLLVDPDPSIHAQVARHVLEVFQRKQRQWIDDPGGLRPVRARLSALLEPGRTPPPAEALRQVLALIDDTLAPFTRTAPDSLPTAQAGLPRPLPGEQPSPARAAPPAQTPNGAPATEWSVLDATSHRLPEDVRAMLVALGPERRGAFGRAISVEVLRWLERKIHPWFSRSTRDDADVDVFAVERRETRLVLHFIADHFNYNFAQSGSDWADHYLFVGEAELKGHALGRVTFSLEREVHLTEHQSEHYDPRLIRGLVRAELRARRAGGPADRSAFDAAVAAVYAASSARAAAANARSAAPTAAAKPTPVARCPKCVSLKIHCELLFDSYQLACKDCGHSEMFETWPEPDSDDHWYS